ncbi:MAG: type 4a pilus biogenesis protein PilO [Patescibacteria group bacterium]
MKSSTKRLVSIAIVALLFISALVVYGSFIKPVYEDIKAKRAELSSQRAIEKQLRTAAEQIQNLLAQYQDIGLVRETVSVILPNEQAMPQAVAQITGLAENNSLSIQSLTSQYLAIKPSGDSNLIRGLGTLRFDVRLIGDYKSLKAFVGQLENNIRLMDLVSLKVDPVGAPGKDIFLYTVTVDTYYQTN